MEFLINKRILPVLFFLPVLLNLSCIGKAPVKTKPPASVTDTVRINASAVVFYQPDSLQLEKIRDANDTMIFESMMHECFYQLRNSRNVVQQNYPGIKIMEVKNARYLLFEKAGGLKECIDLNTKNDPCGIFLFNGKQAPRLADMTNIESELGFYFTQ